MKQIFFLLLLAFSATAQKAVGLRAGVNVTKITRTVFSARTAFYAGLTGEKQISNRYALQLEAGYSSQGASGDVVDTKPVNRTFTDSEISAHYFTLGLMNKFRFHPAFSLLAGASGEQELSNNPFLVRTLDLALALGAEYKFSPGFGLEMRVKRGLFNIFDNSFYSTGQYTGNLLMGSHAHLVLQAGAVYYFK